MEVFVERLAWLPLKLRLVVKCRNLHFNYLLEWNNQFYVHFILK